MKLTAKEKRRRYRLHYNLRSRGNQVDARAKSVTRRAKTLPAIEEKWCGELTRKGYLVGNGIFTPNTAP